MLFRSVDLIESTPVVRLWQAVILFAVARPMAKDVPLSATSSAISATTIAGEGSLIARSYAPRMSAAKQRLERG